MIDLSEAVHHWLEYQRCIGIDRFLNESALTIPIVAYLRSQGWDTKMETDYGKICSSVTGGKCFADFFFNRANDNLILETKFFKSSSHNDIFNDLVRLALPQSSIQRYALLVWFKGNPPPWGPFRGLLGLQKGSALELDPHQATLTVAGKKSQLKYNAEKFGALCAFGHPLSTISATCVQRSESPSESSGYGVIVMSVGRS